MTKRKPSGFWEGIQRSHLMRVVALYLGGSFAGLQTVDIFTDQLGLPDWVFPGSLVLILIGLPIVVATAIVHGRAATHEEDRAAGASDGRASGADAETEHGKILGVRVKGPFLTWRRALIGGGLVVLVWGLIVGGYMAMRSFGIGPVGSLVAAGVLDERERVILADFENSTADPLLGRAATEAFRIDLSQSTIVTVVDPAYVSQVLRRMEGDPQSILGPDLAREVAIREGIGAVVAGEITPVGGGYVLAARLISASDGQVLTAHRETAADSTEIIGAIDRLSKKLRERIGESLKTIRANESLEVVTTPSLHALRKYSQAVAAIESGDDERGVGLLEEAVQLDTAFAMAHRKLGVTLSNIGRERDRAVEALTKAYEHSDRLTERERYLTVGSYYSAVTHEVDKAIAAYRSLLDIYPDDPWALNNLAVLYLDERDYRGAEELLIRSIEIDSASAFNYSNALTAQVAQSEFDAAALTLERFAANFPGHPMVSKSAAQLAGARFDYTAADDRIAQLRESQRTSRFWQLTTSFMLASVDEVRGRLREAERHIRDGIALAEADEDYATAIAGVTRIALHDAMLRGNSEAARLKIEEAVRRYPFDSIPVLQRPYGLLAISYSYVGQPAKARSYLSTFESSIDPDLVDPEVLSQLEVARGALALAEGRHRDAVEAFQRADVGGCSICVLPLLGQAYDLAGEADSVLAIYERYVDTPWIDRLDSTDWYALGGILERLGGLHELGGDAERAAHYYRRFVQLWENADADLQPRVRSARRALGRLTREGAVTS